MTKLKLAATAVLPENAACLHCTEGLASALSGERGVEHAHTDAGGQLCLHYDAAHWEPDALVRAARLHGATLQASCQGRVWPIGGMDCASCVRTVEEGVATLPGVRAVQASLATGRVTVRFAPQQVSESELRTRLADLGHAVEEAVPTASEMGRVRQWREQLGSRAWRPLVLGVGFVAVAVGLALLGWGTASNVALALAVVAGGWDIARNGVRQLVLTRRLTVDLLMALAAVGALALGEFAEGAAVVLLFVLGEALESLTMERARRSIQALMHLAPEEAARLGPDGATETVPVAALAVGERVLVRPGGRVPTDGVVLAGQAAVDQSAITGESIPVERSAGDALFAGSIVSGGALEVQVTRRASESTLARIVALVEAAQERRAPVQRVVDRFAEWYTPAVVVGAVLLTLVPPLLLGWGWADSVRRALVLLVISCPCALVISTPVSLVAALANAARQGVLIKGGAFLEVLGRVRVVAFDKTGTLTLGRPTVTDVVPLGTLSEAEALALAAALEQRSEHPLAAAIVRAASARGLALPPVEAFVAHVGHGVQARVAGREFRVGRVETEQPLDPATVRLQTALEEAGKSVVLLSQGGEPLALIALADTVRPEAREALAALRRQGVQRIVMLTGDNARAAQAIAAQVGVDEVRAGLLPEEKVAAVESLRQTWGEVAMVGDGVNDAPALAAATVGIAMGAAGTDQALEVADVALMGDDLAKLPAAIALSRATARTIRHNITFSLGVKLIFVLLALPGWATLWMAVFADDGASLLVTANGLRLLRRRTDTV